MWWRFVAALPRVIYLERVEHACYQCGTAIEDGVAFCPRCNAPQIRVAPSTESASDPIPPGTPGEIPPAGRRVFPVQWKQMRIRALPWAVALALLMIPTPQYFWLWMPVAGAAVVWLHSLRNNETISARAGIRVGAFIGAVAFAIWGAVLASSVAYDRLVLHRPDRLTQGLRQSLEQVAARNPDPQVQQRVVELLSNPEGMGLYFLVSMVIMFLLFVLLCATGGALGATLSGRRSGP